MSELLVINLLMIMTICMCLQNTDKIEVIDDESTSWCVVLQNQEADCIANIGDMSCHNQITVDMVIFFFFGLSTLNTNI